MTAVAAGVDPQADGPDRAAAVWADALQAAILTALDPAAFGGVVVTAQAGPVRDAWLGALRRLWPGSRPFRRLPGHVSDDRLLGGLDLAATLASGRAVTQRGLLAEADRGLVLLPMAERLPTGVASRLAATLDSGEVRLERDGLGGRLPARIGVVALDESLPEDGGVSPALADRLAFRCDLTALSLRDVPAGAADDGLAAGLEAVRLRLPGPPPPEWASEAVVQLGAAFGVASTRALLFTLRAASALALLEGRAALEDADVTRAARLVIAPRATRLPAPPEEAPEAEPEPPQQRERDPGEKGESDSGSPPVGGALDDVVLESVRAAIPAGLLEQIASAGRRRGGGDSRGGQGELQGARLRGRPIGARPGRLDGRSRLHVVETLRAAAPWQRLRRDERGGDRGGDVLSGADAKPRIEVRASDVRIHRYRQRRETLTIFVVDASGSAALHRLAEAKGAVELLLAECYQRRDEVALVAFRGAGAELLLPPTRSLVRAKHCLAALPGGGATPLAAGIDMAGELVREALRKGRSAKVLLLTDGSANVGYRGSGDREAARGDALAAGRRLASAGAAVLLLDTAPRADRRAAELAEALAARYLPLPHADAARIVDAAGAG